MGSRELHRKSMNSINDVLGWFFDSGTEYFNAINEVASELPDSPFLTEEMDELVDYKNDENHNVCLFIIFAKADHSEILPWIRRFLMVAKKSDEKLSAAAAMAQLGDESGYEFIENLFKRYMQKDEDMKSFDIESFMFVFEEILTNERGKEMLARFRKEANYYVVWETYLPPED